MNSSYCLERKFMHDIYFIYIYIFQKKKLKKYTMYCLEWKFGRDRLILQKIKIDDVFN